MNDFFGTNLNIDPNMKKVFKQELSTLDKYRLIADDTGLSDDELRKNYQMLLESYRLLLQDAMKITTIGDINQKKLYDAFEELEKQRSALYQLSITDHLTQIYNRSYIMNAFDEAVAQHKRYQQPFSCILLDIDDFKSINDTYGHPIGDLVLKETARQIAGQIRETDLLGRYGGEEFLIVLPNTHAEQAEQVAEKIRVTIENMNLGKKELRVTVSQGICDSQVKVSRANDTLLHHADVALYDAKRNGKNCSVTYSVLSEF